MYLDKLKKFRLSKAAALVLSGVVALGGIGVMTLANQTHAAESVKTAAVSGQEAKLSVPGAGMGDTLTDYVGATSGTSVELLSTTAVAASLDNSYNEYYDENGNTIGKLIVYNGASAADVYDKIVGNERIEAGEIPASVIGHMYPGDVATLVREQGDWYQIISASVNGYVRSEGFVSGKEAEALDANTYVSAAYSNSDEVILYADADLNSSVICVLPSGIRYTFLEYGDPFSKISVPGVGEGWILNTDGYFQTERRYATVLADEIYDSTRISEGVVLAEGIEEARTAAEEVLAQPVEAAQVIQAINIAPAPADTSDVAAMRQAVADYAQQFVGVLPYIWGSSDLSYGADCSGFTSAIYREYGIDIPRTTDGQFYSGQQVSMDDLRPGDVICYSGHVALYIGNGTIVHESVPGTTVSYADMYMMPPIGAVRFIN